MCLGEVDNRLDSWEKEVAQTKYEVIRLSKLSSNLSQGVVSASDSVVKQIFSVFEGIETYKIFDWLQKHLQKCRSKMYLYFSDFLSDMVCKDK